MTFSIDLRLLRKPCRHDLGAAMLLENSGSYWQTKIKSCTNSFLVELVTHGRNTQHCVESLPLAVSRDGFDAVSFFFSVRRSEVTATGSTTWTSRRTTEGGS